MAKKKGKGRKGKRKTRNTNALRISEIIPNDEALKRIKKGKIICVMAEPPIFDSEGEEYFPDNMLVLILEKKNKYRLVMLPGENFRNAFVYKNIPKKVIKGMLKVEKIKSELFSKMWSGEITIFIDSDIKEQKHKHKHERNCMYV